MRKITAHCVYVELKEQSLNDLNYSFALFVKLYFMKFIVNQIESACFVCVFFFVHVYKTMCVLHRH